MRLHGFTGLSAILATPAIAAQEAANPFAGQIYQAAAAVIVFLVVLVVLKKYAWSRILQGLQDREAKIQNDLENAEKSAKQAQATLDEYKQRMSGAENEVRQLLDKARTDAHAISARLKEQAQADIDQMRSRAEANITTAKEQALGEIYAQVATLSTEVAGRILQRQIDAPAQQQLVDEILEQLRTTKS